ncbi:histidine phosphatase family protein [Sporolactobacillus kofuensis]|uniref:Histidine phosphatase family protein n=1 Tax=Sporolactobacillus kofuensis TaxID=269672 RepID=A0ABW1WE24_9BACL|nr:histidine phosphatase family protein [Sporolactobacillus kofuensis]MCO7174924.1 histidine phosphatase family protein [Sporolactobacillus kofuensis]
MKTIYFVRHGQTLFNKLGRVQGISDSPLTQLGETAADQLGTLFKEQNIRFDVAYTSDLGRARQTTKRIIDHSNDPDTPIMEVTDLREVSFGSFEGGLSETMWAEASQVSNGLVVRDASSDENKMKILATIKAIDTVDLAESFEDATERVNRVLQMIRTSNASNLLLVSHCLFIDCVLCVLHGQDYHATYIPNTSVTKIVYDQGTFTVKYIGEVEHF